MPALRAASVRLFPSSTNAGASIPRDARTSVARTTFDAAQMLKAPFA